MSKATIEEDASQLGPFPDELLVVPGFVEQVVDYNLAGAIKPQPVLALAAALCLLAVLTGRKIADPYGTRTNLYALGVCDSGGGKERARRVNKEILFGAGLGKLAGPEGLASHAGLITAIELQPSILFQLDEIGRLLKTLGNPRQSPHLYHIATVLMKLFTSSDSVYVGDAYADAKNNKTIYQPHACLYGTTVPESLYAGLSAESLTDGFLSRMLIFESADNDPDPVAMKKIDPPASLIEAARWWGNFNPGGNLSGQTPQPFVVPYTDEARETMRALEALARGERKRADGGKVSTMWTRTTEKARKLALLWACSANAFDPKVDRHAAEWAAAVSEYLTRQMVAIGQEWIAENHHEATLKRLLRTIRKAGAAGLTATVLNAKTSHLRSRERQELLDSLEIAGDIFIRVEPTKGRAKRTYVAAEVVDD